MTDLTGMIHTISHYGPIAGTWTTREGATVEGGNQHWLEGQKVVLKTRRQSDHCGVYYLAIPHTENGLSAVVGNINQRFGQGTIMQLGERKGSADVIPSGIPELDTVLGIGGYPKGRVIEIFGAESSGKTTLVLHAIAEAQRSGGTAALIDAEHALDVVYAGKLGVQVDKLLVAQPDSGEQALEITEALVRSGAVDLVVVDSVATLVPQAEFEGEMGDAHMGLQARLMSQALRRLTAIASRTNAIVIFVTPVKPKLGVTFGNGEVTTGGNALKFYASVRLEVSRSDSKIRYKTVKNKLAPPFRSAEISIPTVQTDEDGRPLYRRVPRPEFCETCAGCPGCLTYTPPRVFIVVNTENGTLNGKRWEEWKSIENAIRHQINVTDVLRPNADLDLIEWAETAKPGDVTSHEGGFLIFCASSTLEG